MIFFNSIDRRSLFCLDNHFSISVVVTGKAWRNAKMLGAPSAHGFHNRDQFVAGIAQHVIHAGRNRMCREPLDDSVPLEFTQLESQHLFTDSRQQVANLGKAQGAEGAESADPR